MPENATRLWNSLNFRSGAAIDLILGSCNVMYFL
jgi:hypothetical protein